MAWAHIAAAQHPAVAQDCAIRLGGYQTGAIAFRACSEPIAPLTAIPAGNLLSHLTLRAYGRWIAALAVAAMKSRLRRRESGRSYR
jgi:hypothetical protein